MAIAFLSAERSKDPNRQVNNICTGCLDMRLPKYVCGNSLGRVCDPVSGQLGPFN
jgi:hypothetical protein